MKQTKGKSIKWWMGLSLCAMLFLTIGIFAYMKTSYIIKGVQISAHIDSSDSTTLINIKGNAKNAVYLTLNGREIFIDKDGNFAEPIAILPGLSVMTLEAQDKFGKSAEKKFEIMHRDSAGAVAFGNTVINTN